MSRRPNRILVGLVLLIGLSLAWYWIRHERLGLAISERFAHLPGALVSAHVRG
jgi:hypothetical protein